MAVQTKSSFNLSYVDFVPQCLRKGGIFSGPPQYDRYHVLVDGANEWLLRNPHVRVKTAESIEIKWRQDSQTAIDTDTSTYIDRVKGGMLYIRALRLWLVPREEDDPPGPMQIKHYTVVPECTQKGGVFKIPKYENFSQTLDRVNNHLRTNPLPGRLINVETQDMKFHQSLNSPDPDETCWVESPKGVFYVNVIQLFYEVGVPAHQEIGCADFTPDVMEGSSCSYNVAKYEPFGIVVAKAHEWIRQNPGLPVLNVQSIDYKLNRRDYPSVPDTHRTTYVEQGQAATIYVRIVRVVYVTGREGYIDPAPRHPGPTALTYKTFLPALLRQGGSLSLPVYEGMSKAMVRVQHWLKQTGVTVLAAETVSLRLMGGNQRGNPEQTLTYNLGNRGEMFLFAIRLYFDRRYQEPPTEELAPEPLPGLNCCVIL